MKKKEILNIIDNISLDKSQYIIMGDASIVLHGLKRECDRIDIKLFDDNSILIDDGVNIVHNQVYEYELINSYQVETLESCLESKKIENNINDKSIIKKIELYVASKDNYKYERDLRSAGYKMIGGVDEVGRGPLVGPVVAACCILPEEFNLEGLTDSKKLSKKAREYYYEEIKKQAVSYGIGIVNEKRIDEVNIYQATKEAMIMAINNCHIKPDYVITDAMKLELDIPVMPIIKGDLKSITISAASVLAKVTRDNMLYELDKKYPMYDFGNNVGYPTKKHLDAIEKYGIIDEHRKSFGPVKKYLEKLIDKKIEN